MIKKKSITYKDSYMNSSGKKHEDNFPESAFVVNNFNFIPFRLNLLVIWNLVLERNLELQDKVIIK